VFLLSIHIPSVQIFPRKEKRGICMAVYAPEYGVQIYDHSNEREKKERDKAVVQQCIQILNE
jgi:hypothetical protein